MTDQVSHPAEDPGGGDNTGKRGGSSNARGRGKARLGEGGKGRGKANPREPERLDNILDSNSYHGNDPIRDVIKSLDRPMPRWYPEPPPQKFCHIPVGTTEQPTPQEVNSYKAAWSTLSKKYSKPLVRLAENSSTSKHRILAFYLGFGDGKGIDLCLYWIDNDAATVFGPMRSAMQELNAQDQGGRVRGPKIYTALTEYISKYDTDTNIKTWLDQVQDISASYADINFQGQEKIAKDSFRDLLIVGCLRIMKAFPDLFVESDANPNPPESSSLTQHFLGHSGEDWNRAMSAARFFLNRRQSGAYQTKNIKSPSSIHPSSAALKWIQSTQEEQANTTADKGYQVKTSWVFTAEDITRTLEEAGITEALNIEEWKKYEILSSGQKEEYAMEFADSMDRFQNLIARNTSRTEAIDRLPFMTKPEQDLIIEKLGTRYKALEEGKDTGLPSFTLPAPVLDDDDQPTGYSQQHQDFLCRLNLMFGGNDSKSITFEEAKRITGWDWKDPRIDPNREDSPVLRPHQIIDIAMMIHRLQYYPRTVLLSSSHGIGKTVIYLGTILQINLSLNERFKQETPETPEENRTKFYPSLIICPSSVVHHQFEECLGYFRNLLVPKLYYGAAASNEATPAKHSATIGVNDLGRFYNTLDDRDPDTAKIVIISSYATFSRRATASYTKTRHQLNQEERVFLGLHIGDSPTNDDYGPNELEEDEVDHTQLPEKGLRMKRRNTGEIDIQAKRSSYIARIRRQRVAKDRGVDTPNLFEQDLIYDSDNEQILEEYADDEADPSEEHVAREDRDTAMSDSTITSHDPTSKVAKKEATYEIFTSKFDQKFNVIICDEAHLAKNRAATFHKTIKCLPREHLILCTATPMVNSTKDILSYALLACPNAYPHPVSVDFSYNSFYGPGAEFTNYGPNHNPHKNFLSKAVLSPNLNSLLQDPIDNDAIIKERLVSLENVEQGHALVDPDVHGDEYADMMAAASAGRPPWLVNPANIYWALQEFGHDFEGSRKVIRQVLEQISVKRGMQTKLQLPDGRVICPADSIPPTTFAVHDLYAHDEQQAKLDLLYQEWKKRLYSVSPKQDAKADEARDSKKDLHQRSPEETQSGKINIKALRHLLLPAFDWKNLGLLEPSKKTIGYPKAFPQEVVINSDEEAWVAQHKLAELDQLAPKNIVKGKLKSTGDGGAAWLFETLKIREEYATPERRYAFLKFNCWESPVLSRVLIQVYEWMNAPKGDVNLPNRVVIMAAMPWVQQQLCMNLRMFGWRVMDIRSDHSNSERNRIIQDFNDPKADVDIFVSSIELSACGINLHKSCCKGILVQWPWSCNNLVQTLGRLPRIGQQRPVQWVTFNVAGTMYDRMQTIIWSKYIPQLGVESTIPDTIHNEPAKIAAYTILSLLFNMPFNRYLWDRTVYDLDIAAVLDPKQRAIRLARFFNLLGKKILEEVNDSNDEDTKEIIKSLNARTADDFAAGAALWERGDESQLRPELTWSWLRDNCYVSNIQDEIDQDWVRDIIPDQIYDALTPGKGTNKAPTDKVRRESRRKLRSIVPDAESDEDSMGDEQQREDNDVDGQDDHANDEDDNDAGNIPTAEADQPSSSKKRPMPQGGDREPKRPRTDMGLGSSSAASNSQAPTDSTEQYNRTSDEEAVVEAAGHMS
ncbi:putative snf2 family helicase protein [Daldinia childiae]|uniref:putative snf2 family helicase protein n=1 Tax=Daldinia childiae TaxID=326645 RepID=UPI0014450252|nr:putative snf2 family helicase protein [Daldinia childiae]KAF3068361.1 putative snf2 family helicase protein [Daldinia childiae]